MRAAYRRWAGVYDQVFGGVSAFGRRRAVSLVNNLPGTHVLEVGVGTGLALPHYRPEKRITGIDLSAEMLARARERAASLDLGNVTALREMDAEAMEFPDGHFDVAVAMFVASVVPHPRRLLAEMRRVVRPGGQILFVNHFAAERGFRWWVERAHGAGITCARLAPRLRDRRAVRARGSRPDADRVGAAFRYLHAGPIAELRLRADAASALLVSGRRLICLEGSCTPGHGAC